MLMKKWTRLMMRMIKWQMAKVKNCMKAQRGIKIFAEGRKEN